MTAVVQDTLQRLVTELKDPLVLEVTVIALAGFIALWMILRLRSSLTRLRGRKLLVQYLEGVEAGLSGDPEAAAELLSSVVQVDPENVGARLALGDALYRLRRPAEAHQQHMEAREVFDVGGPGVRLSVVRDLRAAGELAEAVDRLDEALEEHPRDYDLLEEAFELKTEAGLFEGALAAGRVLFERQHGKDVRHRLAVTAARAGMVSLSRGDRRKAEALFRESLAYDPENHDARTGRLLLAPDPDLRLLPSKTDSERQDVVPWKDSPFPTILDFFPESICRVCSSPRPAAAPVCAVCGSGAGAVYAERMLPTAIEAPDESLDEIEENEQWFRHLAVRIRDGDSSALLAIEEGGGKAFGPLLLVMLDEGDVAERLQDACIRVGSRFPDQLLAARDALKAEGRGMLHRLAGRADVDVPLGPVFRRLSSRALPSFRDLVRDGSRLGDRGLRSLVIDYFIGLADLQAFEDLASRYAPVEIVRKLNKVPAEELVPLFSLLPAEPSFLREAVLLDPALDQPAALVGAAMRAGTPALPRFRELFVQRGTDSGVFMELVRRLGNADEGACAESLLQHFRFDALQYLVQGFADPDTTAEAQMALARLLRDIGPSAVPELVRCFASTPSDLDNRTVELLASFGNAGVDDLEAAYRQQKGWLGKLGANLLRGRHPRAQIARVLGRVRTPTARAALARLRDGESDAELRSLLKELLRTHVSGGEA